MQFYKPTKQKKWNVFSSLQILVFYFYFVYNVVNPFIYAFMNQAFREDLKKLLKRSWGLRVLEDSPRRVAVVFDDVCRLRSLKKRSCLNPSISEKKLLGFVTQLMLLNFQIKQKKRI